MRKVSDSTRPDSGGRSSGESPSNGDNSEVIARIRAANKRVNLCEVLRNYGIKIEKNPQRPEWSNNIICPFPDHKGAKERTASFAYNFVRQFFHCFGCGRSGGAIEFISGYEGVSRISVAERILSQFGEDSEDDKDYGYEDNLSPILLQGAKDIQLLIHKYKDDPEKIKRIRVMMSWLDSFLVSRSKNRKIDSEALQSRIDRIKELI